MTISNVGSVANFTAQTDTACTNGNGKFSIMSAGVWTNTTDAKHNEFAAGVSFIVAAADFIAAVFRRI